MSVVEVTGPETGFAVSEGVPAAVAVVSGSGSVRRATRAFVDRFWLREGSWDQRPPELRTIADGEVDRLTVMLDGVQADLAAVIDGDDRRLVVVTLPAGRGAAAGQYPGASSQPPSPDAPSPLLQEPLDDSPAIVWLKGLDGRYLRVNQGYLEQLHTDAEHICGRTDAELTASGSIEGPRLQAPALAGQEPLELEYTIAAYGDRPAFAVLRFALRDGDGQPTAVCGVAAPVGEASVARSECERLMRIDRWEMLDVFAIRQVLLEEWGLKLADGSSGPPLDRDDRVAAVLGERDEALATASRLEEELVSSQAQTSELEAQLTAVQAELDERAARVEVLEAAAGPPEGGGPRWGVGPHRALSATLLGLTEWQSVLEAAVGKIGFEGGWDVAIAWRPDAERGTMRSAATWVRDPASLGAFESRARQHRQDAATAEFGRARNRMAATCLLELSSAEDPLLRDAAEMGIGLAVLAPIRDGAETIAMLELLSRTGDAPAGDLMVGLEGVALQLGAMAQLLKFADAPHWRISKV